jgi:hypothetical protein
MKAAFTVICFVLSFVGLVIGDFKWLVFWGMVAVAIAAFKEK